MIVLFCHWGRENFGDVSLLIQEAFLVRTSYHCTIVSSSREKCQLRWMRLKDAFRFVLVSLSVSEVHYSPATSRIGTGALRVPGSLRPPGFTATTRTCSRSPAVRFLMQYRLDEDKSSLATTQSDAAWKQRISKDKKSIAISGFC